MTEFKDANDCPAALFERQFRLQLTEEEQCDLPIENNSSVLWVQDLLCMAGQDKKTVARRFSLDEADLNDEMHHALSEACEHLIDQLADEKSTAISIAVDTLSRFVKSHPRLSEVTQRHEVAPRDWQPFRRFPHDRHITLGWGNLSSYTFMPYSPTSEFEDEALLGAAPKDLGLTQEFFNQAGWDREEDLLEDFEALPAFALSLVRSTDPFVAVSRRNFFAAFKRRADIPSDLPERGVAFWDQCMKGLTPPPIDFVKSAQTIIPKTGINLRDDVARHCLRLTKIDAELGRAFHTALFAAVNSGSGSADWDAVVLALATFVHCLPQYAELAEPGVFHEPFGDSTEWVLWCD